MQAIQSRYYPATDRLKAWCERGSITIPCPNALSGAECHREAVRQLLAKFEAEDVAQFGCGDHHWGDFVTGSLPGRDYAHVLTRCR